MQKRTVGVEVLYNYDNAKYYKTDLNNGDQALCDVQGHPVPRFYQDFSGNASTLDRKETGRWDDIPVLHTIKDIPDYIGRPAKYVGYQQIPRPGIKMKITPNTTCAYTLPNYLEPIPPKLGKVSVKVKAEKKAKPLSSRQKELPSFLSSLESQYAPSLALNNYLAKTLPQMQNSGDVAALKAKNKQMVMEDGIDIMGELRKHRMETKGRFGASKPPFTPLEIKLKEKERDKLVNPTANARATKAYKEDKSLLLKRRRDRYGSSVPGDDDDET